jgi:flagellar basal body P-ring formation protein FlgA
MRATQQFRLRPSAETRGRRRYIRRRNILQLLSTLLAVMSVAGSATAEIRSLPVPAVTVYPGETITAAMLTEKQFTGTAQSLNAAVASPQLIVGQVAKRTLLAGRSIPLNSVKPADVVKQGMLTAAVFKSGGLVISTTAVALESGMPGEVIEARNPETGIVIRATVEADGTLLMGAP